MDEKELQDQIRRLADAADALSRSSAGGTNSMKSFADSLKKSAEQLDRDSSISSLGSAATNFGRAVYNSDQSLTKYTSSVDSFTDGIAGIAFSMGPLCAAFGTLVKAVGALAGSTLKYDQAYLDSYDQLSQFGFAGADVADNLHQLTEGTGYTRDRVAELTKISTSLGDDLLGLGKTAGEGTKKFFKIAEVGAATREQFRRLGVSQEELTKHQAEYIKLQSKTGGLQGKSEDTLREESLRYTKNLVKLSALTGKSVDQVEQGMKERMQDYAFNSFIKETEAKQGKEAAERIQLGVEKVAGTFGTSTAKGLTDILANGVATTEEGTALLAATGGDISGWAKQFKEGKMNQDELNKKIAEATNRNDQVLGAAMRANNSLTGKFNNTVETVAGANKMRSDKAEELVDKQLSEAEKFKPGDLKDTQGKAVEAQIAAGTAFDTLTELIAGPINYAFRGLLKGLDMFTKGLTDVLGKFGLVGKEAPYMFKTMEELQSLDATKRKELTDAQVQLSAIDRAKSEGKTKGPAAATGDRSEILSKIQTLQNELSGIQTQIKKSGGTPAPAATPASGTREAPPATKDRGTGDGDISKIMGNSQAGIMSGPKSGYNAPMSGVEAVVPLPDGSSIPVSFKNMPSELTQRDNNPLTDAAGIADIIKGYMSSLTKDTTNVMNQISVNQKESSGITEDMVALVSDKLDTLLVNMKKNNDLQSDLLQYMKR